MVFRSFLKEFFTKESAERGTAVHKACELMYQGTLDMATVDERIRARVGQFRSFLDTIKPDFLLSEERLYSKAYRFAGTIDSLVRIDGKNAIVEIKTGRPGLAAQLQTAAHKILVEEEMGIQVERRYTLELSGKGNFKLSLCAEDYDVQMFIHAVGFVHCRIAAKELVV